MLDEYCRLVDNGQIQVDSTKAGSRYMLQTINLLECNLDLNQIKKVIISIKNDHPEYFWLGNNYSGHRTGDGKMQTFVMEVVPQFNTRQKRAKMKEKLNKAINEFLKDIPRGNDYETELAIHDKIIKETVYDYNAKNSNLTDSINDHNIAGVFIDHVTVCEGYAKAFQLLLNACGIENVYVQGRGNGGSHAWNQVCIDNKYYNVDVTWDDLEGIPFDGISYNYLNVEDVYFNKSHTASTPRSGQYLYNIKTCTSNDYTYLYNNANQYLNS